MNNGGDDEDDDADDDDDCGLGGSCVSVSDRLDRRDIRTTGKPHSHAASACKLSVFSLVH
jgi:hypothetical protein